MKLGDLATSLGGNLVGDPDLDVVDVAEPGSAGPGAIVYAADKATLALAEAGPAAAVLIPLDLEPVRKPAVRVANPRLAFARVLALLAPAVDTTPGVHATAVLGEGVTLGTDVHIGPFVVLGDRVRIGARTAMLVGSVVGADSVIGQDCTIHPHVTIRERTVLGNRVILHAGVVIGADGFGYARGDTGPVKIPHRGRVIVEDDVEIGANTTVDRGTLGETRLGEGTKIDNLVQVGHNVHIGRRVLIAGQVGLSGSVSIGDDAVLAGQVGVRDHVRVGKGATLMGRAGATKDIPPGAVVWGTPAIPHREHLRLLALFRRLPELFQKVDTLQRLLSDRTGRRAPPGRRSS